MRVHHGSRSHSILIQRLGSTAITTAMGRTMYLSMVPYITPQVSVAEFDDLGIRGDRNPWPSLALPLTHTGYLDLVVVDVLRDINDVLGVNRGPICFLRGGVPSLRDHYGRASTRARWSGNERRKSKFRVFRGRIREVGRWAANMCGIAGAAQGRGVFRNA